MGLNLLKTTAARAGRSFSRVAVLTLLLVTILTGYTHAAEKCQFNIPLPQQPSVVIPGPEVSVQIAALSGAWEGQWSNGGVSVLFVYQLDKDSAHVAQYFGENSEYPACHEWARATIHSINQPRLEWKNEWAAFSFELSADGRELFGVFQELTREGETKKYTTVMTRRSIERIRHDQQSPPFICPAFSTKLRLIEQERDFRKRQTMVNVIVEQAQKQGTPLIEAGKDKDSACATFIYRGEEREIAITGFMNGWSEQKDYLSKIADTDLYYFCGEYPADARIEYKFIVDGKAILDPLNPRTAVFGKGSNSEAAMPGYMPPSEIEPDPSVAKGTLEEWTIDSRQPGMSRTANVYLPAGYTESQERYPVLYLNDAFGALKFGRMVTILDNLIGHQVIPPLIAVLLPSVKDRIAEYSMNPVFETFFTEEVVPKVDRRYRTRPSSEYRAIGGISAGATAALSLALNHPDLFGKCMAQSTATKLVPLINLAQTGPKQPIRVYLDVGRLEVDFYGKDLVEANHRIRDALISHNCPVHYREVNDGHGWANWRNRTREALVYLFGAPGLQVSADSTARY